MSDFWIFFEVGMRHILNLSAYDHVLFLIAMTVPYAFKDWKNVLILATLFTLGHTLALLLSVFGIMVIKVNVVELLIPITILITAVFHLFTAGKSAKKESISVIGMITLFFGIIHGLGFATYFSTIIGNSSAKLLPLLEFALGIEAAQLLVLFVVLLLAYFVQTVFRFSKRDWALVLASFVIGVVVPMIIENEIWIRK